MLKLFCKDFQVPTQALNNSIRNVANSGTLTPAHVRERNVI